jgi:hypothetical protein
MLKRQLQLQAAEVAVGDPQADVCTFLDVAVMLAGGVSDAAMAPLFKAARLTLAVKQPAVQKKAHKALAYLFTRRAAVLESCQDAAVAILLDSASVDAACKRFRLQCMLPVILLLTRGQPGSGLAPSNPLSSAPQEPQQAAKLIAELVLGIKEVNAKTRTEAYRVLVATAHALHATHPAQHSLEGACMRAPCNRCRWWHTRWR